MASTHVRETARYALRCQWAASTCVAICATGARTSAAELLVSSYYTHQVSRFDAPTGQFVGPLQLGVGLVNPLCTRVGPDGLLYVASEGADSIQRYNPSSGAFVDTFVAGGSGGLDAPTGMAWGADGNLYVPSFNTDSILKYNGQSGAFLGTFVSAGAGTLDGPDNGTIFGPDGNLYVPSYWNNRILRFNGQTGASMGSFVANIGHPRVLEFRGSSLFITSETANAVRRYNAGTGAFISNFVTPFSGGLSVPSGMAFGPDGNLYVASTSNDNVLRFDGQTGAFIDTFIPAGAGNIDGPVFVTFVPEPGTLTLGAALLIWPSGFRRAGRRPRWMLLSFGH